MKTTDEVNSLINCLTNDEDQRQELWAYYLDGNAVTTLASHLDKINKEYSVDTELQANLWDVLRNPPSDKFYELISHFSEVEQSIVALLALGCTVQQVSSFKGISEVRIRQVISIIRYNDVWSELYGVQEVQHRKRD